MRFVNRQQVDVPTLQIGQKAWEHQSLRRHIKQTIFAVVQATQTRARLIGPSEEFRNVAATPPARNESTWSFINEIRGETTTVNPGRTKAGNWKQSDFPPPVGSSANTSRLPERRG